MSDNQELTNKVAEILNKLGKRDRLIKELAELNEELAPYLAKQSVDKPKGTRTRIDAIINSHLPATLESVIAKMPDHEASKITAMLGDAKKYKLDASSKAYFKIKRKNKSKK